MMKINIKKFILPKLYNMKIITTMVIILACLVPVIAVTNIVRYSFMSNSMMLENSKAKGQCSMIASDIASGNYLADRSSEVINAGLEQLAYTYSARVLVINSDFTIIKDNYVFDEGKIILTKEVIDAFKGKTSSYYSVKTGYGNVTVPITSGEDNVIGVIDIRLYNYNMMENIQYLRVVTRALIIGFAVLVIVVAVIFAVKINKPGDRLCRAILNISKGDKNSRVVPTVIQEYKRIGDAVNTLLDKLETIDNSREEFVSNVSHELKTPMASMKVLADSLLAQDDAPVEIYREFMQDIVEEIDRENKIIGDLLTLVKTDQRGISLNIESVDINGLLELVLKRLNPIAATKKVEITLESVRHVNAYIDKVKFILVITNIVENAIKYNVENGWIRVSLNADHKYFYIEISDSGIGIPPECKDMIFERFYRVDKARARETGGTGLGLAITKNIIMLHRGSISYYSKENKGTTFMIKVPLNYAGGSI